MALTDVEKRKEYNRLYYEKNKCEHGKQKCRCRECNGNSFCEHNKRKNECKLCKGSQICEHDKRKNICKECNGSQICEHGKQKNICTKCGGISICEHKCQRCHCRECKGSQICVHDKIKSICKQCDGSRICEHNRKKTQCKECNLPLYLVTLQRMNIKRCLKNNNLEKTKASIEYLGCDVIYFKKYIESKMTEEMNWNNIHLDHIKPINAFNLDENVEFLKCCHYSNFQPLIASENLSKSDKWNEDDEKFWLENICDKEYKPIYKPKKNLF